MAKYLQLKLGHRYNGLTFDNKRIMGTYRGSRHSFGVYIYGIEVGQVQEPKLYVCRKLSLEPVDPPKPKGKAPKEFTLGQPYNGLTKDGKQASGYYQNADGNYIWIRGWLDTTSKFEPKQSIKILRASVRKGLTSAPTED